MKLYLRVTRDKYELPEAVAESPRARFNCL